MKKYSIPKKKKNHTVEKDDQICDLFHRFLLHTTLLSYSWCDYTLLHCLSLLIFWLPNQGFTGEWTYILRKLFF